MREMEAFVSALELKRTVFRSDHASNWLVLKGTLGADKPRLLEQLRAAIASPETARLRPPGRAASIEIRPNYLPLFTQRHSREGGNPFIKLEQALILGPRLRGDDASGRISTWSPMGLRVQYRRKHMGNQVPGLRR